MAAPIRDIGICSFCSTSSSKVIATYVCDPGPVMHTPTLAAPDGRIYRCDKSKDYCCKPMTTFFCTHDKHLGQGVVATHICTNLVKGSGHDQGIVEGNRVYRCNSCAAFCCQRLDGKKLVLAFTAATPVPIPNPVKAPCRWCNGTKLYYPWRGPAEPCREC